MTPIESLEELGHCKLSGVYTQAETQKCLELLSKYESELPDPYDTTIPRLNRIARNIYCLQNKDIFFVKMLFKDPRIEEILKYFLNDPYYVQIPQHLPNYILRSYGARSTGPTMLPWHIDSFMPYEGHNKLAMQVAIFLEDSTLENGCTHVVPKSHLSGKYASTPMTHESEALTAKAGDVLIWDGRIHHATGSNTTDKTRWGMIATFTRWWVKQAFDIPKGLPPEIFNLLSSKEKSIMGFSSIPARDESEYIDLKKGYE